MGSKSVDWQEADDKCRPASEKSETQGFMKILVDGETKEILGTTILGAGGDEVTATARSKI
ncbi:MAG: hypothetical protein QF466_01910 [Desulfobacterales bacterium]|nr:hypothetical protein [Desulfobacterales bacterium]MDP6682634.1 hypothetical protein [Desulfobacterales bacterium]MDP6808310.1 hypothetical protein [Desulfobacterales bacterium]